MCRDTAKKASIVAMTRELCAAMQSVACVAATTDSGLHTASHLPASLVIGSTRTTLRGSRLPLRVDGSLGHTFDILANVLCDINSSYGITHKVCATTTDNGSNFVKAFSVFGQPRDTTQPPEAWPHPETYPPVIWMGKI